MWFSRSPRRPLESSILLIMIVPRNVLSDLIRDYDWNLSPLGPITSWSESLLASVNLVLSAPFPAVLCWGSALTMLYNDAAIPSLRTRHPKALGMGYAEAFPEVWPFVKTAMEDCLRNGLATVRENVHLVYFEEGQPRDDFWTYSMVPVFEKDHIAGVYHQFVNTTEVVRATQERTAIILRLQQALEELRISNQQLSRVAGTDALTGLANRRAFDENYEEAWRSACEESSNLSIVLVDLDHFKRINDHYGHLFGDQVLRRVARLLSETLRKGEDFAGRYGGEEFVIVLPSTDLESALKVAERVRSIVEAAGLPPLGRRTPPPAFGTTVSCGVASSRPVSGHSPEGLLEGADQALYLAKQQGRNRVCSAEDTGEALIHLR